MRRRGNRAHGTTLLLAALLAAGAAGARGVDAAPGAATRAASAQERSWTIARFDSEIRVQRRGDIVVTERIAVRFTGQYNGVFRFIPVEYRTPTGFNYTLRLDFEEVTDEAGQPLRHETSREGPNRKVKVWIPDAADATRVVVIRYRVKNGIRFLREGEEEWDELYWNVTGNEWPVGIEAAIARVVLPTSATGVRAVAYTGTAGSREEAADVRVQDYVITARMRRPLGFREGLTVAVAWDSRVTPPGGEAGERVFLIRRPTAIARAWSFLRANWALGVPLVVFVVMLRHWRARGRDPERLPIAPQYEPPDGLTPSEVGVLVDNRPDMRDVTAMLVDLAVRGHLRIEETETPKLFGLLRDRDHEFVRRTSAAQWQGLRRHERELLRALFDGGATERVAISDLENEFYKDLPKIRDAVYDELLARGYYGRRPDRVLATYVLLAAVVGIVIGLGGVAVSRWLGTAQLPGILGGALSGAVVAGFGLFMPARTVAGARVLERALGFEDFLQRVESDRFRRMITGPEMFEKYLPFAMALGVEKKWAAAFEGIFREPPEWYTGRVDGSFRPSLFVNQLSDVTGRTASAMSSSPRSSGGSGFGGGGSSGGGFGGGGGGAF